MECAKSVPQDARCATMALVSAKSATARTRQITREDVIVQQAFTSTMLLVNAYEKKSDATVVHSTMEGTVGTVLTVARSALTSAVIVQCAGLIARCRMDGNALAQKELF